MQEFKNKWDKETFNYSLDVSTRLSTVKELLNKALFEIATLEEAAPLKHTEELTTPKGINMKLVLSFRLDKADKQRVARAKKGIQSILTSLESKTPDFFQLEECEVCKD